MFCFAKISIFFEINKVLIKKNKSILSIHWTFSIVEASFVLLHLIIYDEITAQTLKRLKNSVKSLNSI